MTVIRVDNLSKSFDQLKAVDTVSFTVQPKEIYAIIGPNGSGKTTLLKMIVGLQFPDHGHITIINWSLPHDAQAARAAFGYISDNPTAYDYLTGREFLALTGGLRGMDKQAAENTIKELIGNFPLDDIIDQPMAQYSRGNRQKVAYLAALMNKPKLLIIDEPVVGLDPDSINILGQSLKKFAQQGGAVLMVTHILSFAQNYASKVGVLVKGRLVDEKEISVNVSLDDLYQLDTR